MIRKLLHTGTTLFALALLFPGCSDGGSGGGDPDPIDPDLPEKFVAELIDTWLDVDFSLFGNGYSDTDYDGQNDTYDAVNIIESLRALGYDLPATTVNGLHGNYYTEAGYDRETEADSARVDFIYTVSSPVTEEDLKDGDYSGLDYADLIFVNYDVDIFWDNAAVYIGAYGGYEHAAIISSDYYDTTLIIDLENDTVFGLDITYGFSAVRKPAFEHFAEYYVGSD